MNGEELEKYVWDIWMQELDTKADKTKNDYLRNFKRFLKRWNVTPGELYEMRKTDILSIEPVERKRIERMVKTSMSERVKAGFKPRSTHHIANTVSNFFESVGMELNLKKKDKPRGESQGRLATSASQIMEIYDQMVYWSRFRNKAMLLTAKDSGLRVSDISMMDYGDWLQAKTILNEYDEAFKVFDPEETQKMKVIAYVHLGPESITAIDEYLEHRQDRGEILTENSPMFLSRKGDRLSREAMSNVFQRLAKNLKYNRVSAHSFRKFHRTRLEGAGMPVDWVKKLQGKKADVYSQPEEDMSEKYPGLNMLTERYIDCYDVLRILEKPRGEDEQHEKIDKLTHELGLSQYEIAELREERDKYRAGYELRTRLQNIIDKARLDGWPEKIIKKLEENLESVETFEEGVFEFHKLDKDS